jgi:hypothetical protein
MRSQRGAALVEFALIALTLYLLLAGGVELGRMVFVSQTLQDAARLAARELAVTPLPVADSSGNPFTFEDALADTMTVQPSIWNEAMLILDIGGCAGQDLEANLDALPLPIVNRSLRPLFISDTVDLGDGNGPRQLLRYPGALFHVTGGAQTTFPGSCVVVRMDLIPLIPRVVQRNSAGSSSGVETIAWLRVLAEVRSDPTNPGSGPFALGSAANSGLAAVAINYPFQSAMLSAFQKAPPTTTDPLPSNLSNVITADDANVTVQGSLPPGMPAITLVGSASTDNQTYSGQYSLGQQQSALTPSRKVRPFRNLLLGQAIFRREVVQ